MRELTDFPYNHSCLTFLDMTWARLGIILLSSLFTPLSFGPHGERLQGIKMYFSYFSFVA